MSRFLRKHFCRLLSPGKGASSQLTRSTPAPSTPASSHFANLNSTVFKALARNPGNPINIKGGFNSAEVIARGILQQRRFYYVDSRGIKHFRKKGFGGPYGKNKIIMYSLIIITAGGICTIVYATHQEVVPYTFRKHFVLISPEYEAQMVEDQFKAMKQNWKSQILPSIHPQTVRVRKIAKDVIEAVKEGAKLEDDGHLLEEGHKKVEWEGHADTPVTSEWGSGDQVIDDQWAEQSRKKGLQEGAKPFVEHLKLAKWEVLVVDNDQMNAFCLPGGKIVVFTGLLKHFPSDAEIASVLSHEVAHVVARHGVEKMTRSVFVTLFQLFILTFFYAPDLVRTATTLLLELPFSRSQELEADHIGLLVMAAAGYDPRVAPQLLEKMQELQGSSELIQYVTTHPSGKKRGERLRRTGTMEQAVNIYTEKTEGVRTRKMLTGLKSPFTPGIPLTQGSESIRYRWPSGIESEVLPTGLQLLVEECHQLSSYIVCGGLV
eukprot:c9780_g1_i2 orf=63-1532(-)